MTVAADFELHRWRLSPFGAAADAAAWERGGDLWCEGIDGPDHLVWPAEHTAMVTAAYRRFIAQAEGGATEWESYVERLASPMLVDERFAPPRYRYAALLELLAELAPLVEARRWVMETGVTWKDEVWLVGGMLYVERHHAAEPAPYFETLLAEVPDDAPLRAFVIAQWEREAAAQLERLASNALRRDSLREDFGEHADRLHELDAPATRYRQLVGAARAIERVRALGAEVDRWLVRLGMPITPEVVAAVARYDALVVTADALLREQKFQQALAMIELAIATPPAHPDMREHLLRAVALEGMGRGRAARAAYEHHIALTAAPAPYNLLGHARWLAARGRPESAELLFRALVDAPFFYGVAAHIGAAECRAHAGDLAGARALYAGAVAAAAVTTARYRKCGITAESDRYAARARHQLALIDASIGHA